MTLRTSQVNEFTCDKCGTTSVATDSASLPDGWFGLGINLGLGRDGGYRPDANSTLCPTLREQVQFCSEACVRDWIAATFDDLIQRAHIDAEGCRKDRERRESQRRGLLRR